MKPIDPTLYGLWIGAITELSRDGILKDVDGLDSPGVFSARTNGEGWRGIGRELMAIMKRGQISPGKDGLVWLYGPTVLGRLVNRDVLPQIEASRELVRLIVPDAQELPYAVGGCARFLLSWSVRPQERSRTADYLLTGENSLWPYHDCIPGLYDDLTLFDVKSAYYQCLTRLPAPRVSVGQEINWHRVDADELAKWREVLAGVSSLKCLRNSLWGTMLGTKERGRNWAWNKDTQSVKQIPVPFGPGPLRPAALLIARSVAEVTRQASLESGSVYSNLDSVTVTDRRQPTYYDRVGLTVKQEYQGPGEICKLGRWRIGSHATKPYQWGEREYTPVQAYTGPVINYHNLWLS